MIELDTQEIAALEQLTRKASVNLTQAINSGYKPELSADLELLQAIERKLRASKVLHPKIFWPAPSP